MPRPTNVNTAAPAWGAPQRGDTVKREVNATIQVPAGINRGAALAASLGVAVEGYLAYAKGAQAEGSDKGAADAALGNSKAMQPSGFFDSLIHPEKAAYVDAYDRVSAVKAFQGAALDVQQWAQTDGAMLTPDEFAAELDARMKKELDGLQNDPVAAEEIAKRYVPFANNLAQAHRAATQKRLQDDAIETTTADVMASLNADPASVDYAAQVRLLTPILNGDRAQAVKYVVGSYMQAAINAARDTPNVADAQVKAEAILAALPTQFVDENGKTMPGPASSAIHRDALQRTQDTIDQIIGGRQKGDMADQLLALEVDLGARVAAGERITYDDLSPYVKSGIMSEDKAFGWIEKSFKNGIKIQSAQDRVGFLLDSEDQSWRLTIGQVGPDGEPIKESDWQQAFNQMIGGYPEEQRVAAALEWSRKTGLVYEGLKQRLNNAGTFNPEDLSTLLDDYQRVKAEGLSALYVPSAETAAQYERLNELVNVIGLKPDAAIAELKRDPKEVAAYVKRFEKPLRDELSAVDVYGLAPGEDDLINGAYVQKELNTLAQYALSNGASPAAAAEFAKKRFEEGHMKIETPRGSVLMPKVAGLSEDAMQWFYDNALPRYAEAKGLDPEKLRLLPAGPNGEMIVTDENGMRVTTDIYSPQTIGAYYDRAKRNSAMERLKDEQAAAQLRRSDPEAFARLTRQAAIEKQRKFDEDRRKYIEKRAKQVGAYNLPTSEYAWDSRAGVRGTGGTRGRARPVPGVIDAPTDPHPNLPSNLLEKAPEKLMDYVRAEAAAQGLPADIVHGVAMTESSGGKALRNSKSSARGPLHILKDTFEDVNQRTFGGNLDWNDVRDQTRASVAYLREQMGAFPNDPDLGVLGYFLGTTRLRELLAANGGSKEAILDIQLPNNATPRQYLERVKQFASRT